MTIFDGKGNILPSQLKPELPEHTLLNYLTSYGYQPDDAEQIVKAYGNGRFGAAVVKAYELLDHPDDEKHDYAGEAADVIRGWERTQSGQFVPYWETKAWGRVKHVFASPYSAESHLEVLAGKRCSRHFHKERTNQFRCLDAYIAVELWGLQGRHMNDPPQIVPLAPGDNLTVHPGVTHRFRVLEGGRLVEVYWAEQGTVRADDIVRFDEGGQDDIDELRRLLNLPNC